MAAAELFGCRFQVYRNGQIFYTFRQLLVPLKHLRLTAIEVNLQKALAEASETCTQECLILGHSDSCWMPPSLTQYQQSTNPAVPTFGFQQNWARGAKPDGRHTLGRSVPKDEIDKGQGNNRPQFYNTLERHSSLKEDPVKVIPLANFTPSTQQAPASGGTASFVHEHQL
ncbi:PCDH9 protein, partial [Polypterus senegalus]